MVDIQSIRPLRLGEERKIERKKKKPQGKNIMVCPITYGDHNKGEKRLRKLVRKKELKGRGMSKYRICERVK